MPPLRRHACRALAIGAVLSATLPAAAIARQSIVVRSTISGPSGLPERCAAARSESFPQLGAHPGDPRRLSATYLQDGTRAAVGAVSTDGGRSWRRTPIAGATSCSGGPTERHLNFNPLMATGPDGAAYYGASWANDPAEPVARLGTTVHAAAGGGWSPGTSPGRGDTAENQAVVADPRRRGVVHAAWVHHAALPNPYAVMTSDLRVARSTDGAGSFARPVVAARPPAGRHLINDRLARTADGAVLAVYDTVAVADMPNAYTGAVTDFEAFATRSTDDGVTWSKPVPAGRPRFLPLNDPDGTEPPHAPYEAAGSAKFDLATGADNSAIVAWADRAPDGRGILRLRRSTDGGRSWAAEIVAFTRSAALFERAVAIARDGTIGVFFYDWTRDRPGDAALTTDAWLATSPDAGRSWDVTHLDGPFDLRATYEPGLEYDGYAIGVYQDLVAARRGFAAAFTVGPPLAADGATDVRFVRTRSARGDFRASPDSQAFGRSARRSRGDWNS